MSALRVVTSSVPQAHLHIRRVAGEAKAQAYAGERALHVTCAHARRRRHACVDFLQRLVPLVHGAAVVGHHVALRRELFCRQGSTSKAKRRATQQAARAGKGAAELPASAFRVRTAAPVRRTVHASSARARCNANIYGGALCFSSALPTVVTPDAAAVPCRCMSAADAAAPAAAAGEVPTSAPELRDVSDAPAGEALRTYETQLGADELLRQFLSEVSEVARDAEVVRCVCCSRRSAGSASRSGRVAGSCPASS